MRPRSSLAGGVIDGSIRDVSGAVVQSTACVHRQTRVLAAWRTHRSGLCAPV